MRDDREEIAVLHGMLGFFLGFFTCLIGLGMLDFLKDRGDKTPPTYSVKEVSSIDGCKLYHSYMHERGKDIYLKEYMACDGKVMNQVK